METTEEKSVETTEVTETPRKEPSFIKEKATTQSSVGKDILVTGSIIFLYSLSSILVATGFYKLWVYTSPEENSYGYSSGVNAVVGGDAFNYMINATTAVAYFVAALIFVVIASLILLMKTTKNNK